MSKTMRFVIPAALVLAAALGASAAQARNVDVQWSVTIGTPVYAVPAPVYSVLAPVYAVPAPVYVQPRPVYVAPAPVYYGYAPQPVYRGWRHHGPVYWDRDGDGIPNRYDRVYNPAWDRDGDGIPNRHDRSDRDDRDDRYRRDGRQR